MNAELLSESGRVLEGNLSPHPLLLSIWQRPVALCLPLSTPIKPRWGSMVVPTAAGALGSGVTPLAHWLAEPVSCYWSFALPRECGKQQLLFILGSVHLLEVQVVGPQCGLASFHF